MIKEQKQWSVLTADLLDAHAKQKAAAKALSAHCEIADMNAVNWQADYDRLKQVEHDATLFLLGVLDAHAIHQPSAKPPSRASADFSCIECGQAIVTYAGLCDRCYVEDKL